MASVSEAFGHSQITPTMSRWSRVALIMGPLLLGISALLVFLLGPTINGPDAPAKLREFYTGDRSRLQLVAEPLSLIGIFAFLWLVAQVRTAIARVDQNESRAAVAFAGGIVFTVLAGTSLIAQTTVAGTAMFASSFEVDAHTAMLWGHFGYVSLAGAMIAGAAMAFATVGALKAIGRPGLARATYVVGGLGLIANFFVYVPLVAYLIWVTVVGLGLSKATQLLPEGSDR